MYAVIKYRVALDVQYLIKYADRSPYIYMNHEFHDRIGDGVVGGYRKIAKLGVSCQVLKSSKLYTDYRSISLKPEPRSAWVQCDANEHDTHLRRSDR